MNQQSIVDMLEPLRSPEPIAWWPPAPGWWVLAALVVAAIFFVLCLLWRRYQRGSPLREARAHIEKLGREELPPNRLVAELGTLQRRVAMAILGRKACAGLTGGAWADCLNDLSPGPEQYFDEDLLGLAHQAEVSAADSTELLGATERWLCKLRMAP